MLFSIHNAPVSVFPSQVLPLAWNSGQPGSFIEAKLKKNDTDINRSVLGILSSEWHIKAMKQDIRPG